MAVRAFLEKHRRLLSAGAVGLACLLVFALFWFLRVGAAMNKRRTEYLSYDREAGETQALGPGDELRQHITTTQELWGIGVKPTYTGEAPVGLLLLDVYAADGSLLAHVEGNARETLPGQYAFFVFSTPLAQADGSYELVFRTRLEDPQFSLRLLCTEFPPEGWRMLFNGAAEEGALCVGALVDPIGGFVRGLYWALALAGSALAGFLCWLALGQGKPKLHRVYALAAAGLGLLYCFYLPPYAAPDEQFHINQVYNLSSSLLGAAPAGGVEWGENIKRAGDQNPLVEDAKTTVYTYREITRNLFAPSPNNTPTVYQGEGTGNSVVIYLPAVLAVTLGRLLGLGFVAVLFLGRLFMLAAFVALTTLAVKLVPLAKGAFAAVALLPMTLHLAASFNRDGLTIALYMLFTALCLRLAASMQKVTWPHLAVLAALALAAGPAKYVYVPLLLLCFLIPGQRIYFRGKALSRWGGRGVLLGVALLGILPALVGAARMDIVGLAVGWGILPGSGPAAAPLLSQIVPSGFAPPDDSLVFTLSYLFAHPLQALRLVLNSLFSNFALYLRTMVGGQLGYNDILLNDFFFVAPMLLLAGASLPVEGESKLTRRQGGWAVLLALGALGLVVLACVAWTPLHYTTIYGLQGRYLLPVLPVVLLALRGRGGSRLAWRQNPDTALLMGSSLIGLFALLNAFLVILAR